MANEGFLGRWSRLKRDATVPTEPVGADEGAAATAQPAAAPEREAADDPARRAGAGMAVSGRTAAGDERVALAPEVASEAPETPSLPSLESLGFDSDFSPFMRREVDPATRMSALKKLFSDPHFNQMDGLDVYIDDYGKPDPIPPALLAQLNQSRLLGLFKEEEPADASRAVSDGVAGTDAAGNSVAGNDAGNDADAGTDAGADADADSIAGSTESAPPAQAARQLDDEMVAANAPSPEAAPPPDAMTGHGIAPLAVAPQDSPPDSRQAP